MIPKAIRSSVTVWLPPALLALFSALLLPAGPGLVQRLRYDRADVAAGQWWRLLTGNFVHLSAWHYVFNALSLVLLVALCPLRIGALDWLARVVVVSIGTCLGMYWFTPHITAYVGLSGMIYGLFFLGLGSQALAGDRIAMACLIFLGCRIGFEFVVGIPSSEERLIGGHVVPESHLFGVLAAGIYAAARAGVVRMSSERRRSRTARVP